MTEPLFVARLAGTQAEMGAQHGALCADDAAALFAFYRTMPERALVGDVTGAPGVVARWLARRVAGAWQARLATERPPELAARTRAFVEAVVARKPELAGTRDAAHLLATMDSLQNCVAAVGRAKLGPFAPARAPGALDAIAERARLAAIPACSTAIAWGRATPDGELLFARNFDFPGVGVWDAKPSFVACAPAGGQRYGFFATRGADTPVVTVVNEAGLVIAPHTRWHAGVTWGGGMIVDLIHAIAQRAESLADAIAIARERPISSSWGVAIGSARERRAIVVEIAGPRVAVVEPAAGADHLVCTNRYRAAEMQDGQLAASSAWSEHSERRERRLRELIATALGRGETLDAARLASFLGDRCDHASPEVTRRLGATLAQAGNVHCAVVAPAARRAWVGVDAAPACHGEFAELAWTWDGPRGGWSTTDPAARAAGFAVTTRADFTRAQDPATRLVHEAVHAYESRHDVGVARGAIERAIAYAPDDPSLRLAASWLAFEAGEPARATEHARDGLAIEREPLRRAQLLLWGARAARAAGPTADPARSRDAWLGELAAMTAPEVVDLQRAATRPFRGKPHVNLMMLDAY